MSDKAGNDADREYRELLEFLFERHIRPHMPAIRERLDHHLHDEWSHQLARAIRAAKLTRFIEAYCASDDEVFRTITREQLQRTIRDAAYSEGFAHRLIERGGFEEVIEQYAAEIATGLSPDHLPAVDEAVMREIGSPNPRVELRLLVSHAKTMLERRARYSEGKFVQMVRQGDLEERLEQAAKEFEQDPNSMSDDNPDHPHPKKSRRWFKGIGQIGQGAALTIANVGLAASVFHLPVSPETQTWGAITSVIAGLGSIANGIGDLRGE
jgi:hypothetical protein